MIIPDDVLDENQLLENFQKFINDNKHLADPTLFCVSLLVVILEIVTAHTPSQNSAEEIQDQIWETAKRLHKMIDKYTE